SFIAVREDGDCRCCENGNGRSQLEQKPLPIVAILARYQGKGKRKDVVVAIEAVCDQQGSVAEGHLYKGAIGCEEMNKEALALHLIPCCHSYSATFDPRRRGVAHVDAQGTSYVLLEDLGLDGWRGPHYSTKHFGQDARLDIGDRQAEKAGVGRPDKLCKKYTIATSVLEKVPDAGQEGGRWGRQKGEEGEGPCTKFLRGLKKEEVEENWHVTIGARKSYFRAAQVYAHPTAVRLGRDDWQYVASSSAASELNGHG
ncbi:hypothetical protein BDK51DRAFT_28464, partial [Blyttiomyces helicus]